MNLIEKLKKLREETGISISECKKALIKADGDIGKAKELLKEISKEIAEKKMKRETKHGIVEAYVHHGRKIGVLLELYCESDFVATSQEFQKLAHELCLQVAAVSPEEKPLLEQNWIKDEKKTIRELIEEHIAKFGEKIEIGKVFRCEI